jgi:predicted flap endonuclease-1-like 5' DNA nuclease
MTFVSDLKGDVFRMQVDFRKARTEGAGKTRDEREKYVFNLKKTVADLLQGFSADLEGARSVWFETTNIKHKVSEERKQKAIKRKALSETKPEVTEETPVEHAEVESEKTEEAPVKELIPDDLTIIMGIGKGMQAHLNEAGIYTYSQIAESTSENLSKALGKKLSRLATNIENWIEQAKELAKQP